jgi:DNA-binding transcriptional ArsR family regulator
MVLCSLLSGELAVGDLVRALGLSQSNLSQHLTRLRKVGLVATRRCGTTVLYRIGSDQIVPILTALELIVREHRNPT